MEMETAADGAAVAPSAAVSAPPSVEELRASMTAHPVRALSDAALAIRIERVVQESQWAMQKYLGHRRRDADVSDAPRVAYDLDEALKSLHASSATLKPLVADSPAANESGDVTPPVRILQPHEPRGSSLFAACPRPAVSCSEPRRGCQSTTQGGAVVVTLSHGPLSLRSSATQAATLPHRPPRSRLRGSGRGRAVRPNAGRSQGICSPSRTGRTGPEGVRSRPTLLRRCGNRPDGQVKHPVLAHSDSLLKRMPAYSSSSPSTSSAIVSPETPAVAVAHAATARRNAVCTSPLRSPKCPTLSSASKGRAANRSASTAVVLVSPTP